MQEQLGKTSTCTYKLVNKLSVGNTTLELLHKKNHNILMIYRPLQPYHTKSPCTAQNEIMQNPNLTHTQVICIPITPYCCCKIQFLSKIYIFFSKVQQICCGQIFKVKYPQKNLRGKIKISGQAQHFWGGYKQTFFALLRQARFYLASAAAV